MTVRAAGRRGAAGGGPPGEPSTGEPPAVELLDARPHLPGVPDLGPGPTVQLWPHRHGTDAMFLALVRRTR